MTIERDTALQIAHRDRINDILSRTGGEIIHPDHYDLREALRLAVLEAVDITTEMLNRPKMSDGELPALFRAIDGIAERIFLKGAGL